MVNYMGAVAIPKRYPNIPWKSSKTSNLPTTTQKIGDPWTIGMFVHPYYPCDIRYVYLYMYTCIRWTYSTPFVSNDIRFHVEGPMAETAEVDPFEDPGRRCFKPMSQWVDPWWVCWREPVIQGIHGHINSSHLLGFGIRVWVLEPHALSRFMKPAWLPPQHGMPWMPIMTSNSCQLGCTCTGPRFRDTMFSLLLLNYTFIKWIEPTH